MTSTRGKCRGQQRLAHLPAPFQPTFPSGTSLLPPMDSLGWFLPRCRGRESLIKLVRLSGASLVDDVAVVVVAPV